MNTSRQAIGAGRVRFWKGFVGVIKSDYANNMEEKELQPHNGGDEKAAMGYSFIREMGVLFPCRNGFTLRSELFCQADPSKFRGTS
jgi:hypothetical protein